MPGYRSLLKKTRDDVEVVGGGDRVSTCLQGVDRRWARLSVTSRDILDLGACLILASDSVGSLPVSQRVCLRNL